MLTRLLHANPLSRSAIRISISAPEKILPSSELAMIVKEIVGFDGVIEWDTSKPDGTFQKLLSVKKIHDLGWEEKISLEQGIKKVYEEYLS